MATTGNLLNGVLVVLLLVTLTGLGLSYFNTEFDQEYSLGLSTDALSDIDTTLGSSKDLTVGGDVEQVDNGLSLTSSWAISKGLFSLLWEFVNGTWISNLMVNTMNLGVAGAVIATVIRMLFIALLIFAVIKLFFKTPL